MIEKKSIWSIITASSLGTVIEWYDFYIFGSLAPIIATQFFPKENPTAAFLATLAAFGVGFVIRPFGALVFGRLGDLMGRKSTFLLTLILMGVSTFAIGLIPSYETIGILAPIIVFVLRAVQGLALGGEYGGAAIYVAEHAPEGKKGYFTSFIQTTATFGLLLSLAVILLCKYFVPEGQFEVWGWRLPFLVSVILVVVSYFIRTKMDESPVFQQMKAAGKTAKNPLKESFTKWRNLRLVLIALFGAAAGQGVIWYTGQFYAMNFSIKTLHIQEDQIQYMLYFLITKWEKCVNALLGCETCGVDLRVAPTLHYSGNFWWSTANNIISLPSPIQFNNLNRYPNQLNSLRHNQEFWVCYNKNNKHISLWDCGINVYERHLHRYPPSLYAS